MSPKLPYKSDGQVTKPAVVKKYGNGKIPRDVLAPCGIGNHRLAEPAARATRAMVAAAAADGVSLGASDSYRTYDQQLRGFKNRYSKTPISGRSTKTWNGTKYWLKPNQAMAATPGTSNHGWGIALDLAQGDGNPKIAKTMWLNWKSLNWLAANGPSFGFWNSVKSEAWHWAYFPGDNMPPAVLQMERTGKVKTPKATKVAPAPKNAKDRAAFYSGVRFKAELKKGSFGTEVEAAQWALTKAGFPADIDGDFGGKTTSAVKAFQASESLKADGKVGKNTWGGLGLPGGNRAPAAKKATAKKATAKKATAKKATAKKATAVAFTAPLSVGSSGAEVEAVQSKLAEFGYAVDKTDKFGARTKKAVTHFQKVNGLEENGTVDAALWGLLGL